MQRRSKPLAWRPRGASDTLESTGTFTGAMARLTNLIPDPSTRGLWQSRPAALRQTVFASFAAPGFISVCRVMGDNVYGMIATALNAGKDQPFAFNLTTGLFTAITGITNANTPTSPATAGAWVPPTMALIGPRFIVTHPGFAATMSTVAFGVLNIANAGAPTWAGATMGGAIAFTVPPTAVAQFNNRAWYAVNPPTGQPSLVYSDPLAPTNATNANQALTFGDNVPITALGGLGLANQVVGGIVQALMVFKGVQAIVQVTGDAASANLKQDDLKVTTGTLAPNTVCSTPKGLAFVAPDGLRMIGFNGQVSDPVGTDGMGITVPFIYSLVPSRMCAACNGSVIRITTQNNNAPGNPFQEWWLELARDGIWHGPHSFPASIIQAYSNTFVMAPEGVLGSLWRSDPVQSGTSVFIENGVQMQFEFKTALLPDTEQMVECSMTEATIDLALPPLVPGATVFTMRAFSQDDAIFDTLEIPSPGGASLWGQFQWGQGLWGGGSNALAPRQLPWTHPIVFSRIGFDLTGLCSAELKVGALRGRYQLLRYLIQGA